MQLQYQFYIYHGKNTTFKNQKSGEISKRKNKKSTLITVFTVHCFEIHCLFLGHLTVSHEVLLYRAHLRAPACSMTKLVLKMLFLLSKFHSNWGRGFESQTSLVFFKPFLSSKIPKNSFSYLILTQTIPWLHWTHKTKK